MYISYYKKAIKDLIKKTPETLYKCRRVGVE